MISGAYRDIHSTIDGIASHLSGLSHALWNTARETSCITHGGRDANAIMAMIDVIDVIGEKVEALAKAQEKAWEIAKTATWPNEEAA